MKIIQDAVPALAPDEIVLRVLRQRFRRASRRSRLSGFARQFEPRYRPAWLPRIVQVSRRLHRGRVRWRYAGTASGKPFLAAVPDPTNPWTTRETELAPKVDPDIAGAMRRATFNPHAVDELVRIRRINSSVSST